MHNEKKETGAGTALREFFVRTGQGSGPIYFGAGSCATAENKAETTGKYHSRPDYVCTPLQCVV